MSKLDGQLPVEVPTGYASREALIEEYSLTDEQFENICKVEGTVDHKPLRDNGFYYKSGFICRRILYIKNNRSARQLGNPSDKIEHVASDVVVSVDFVRFQAELKELRRAGFCTQADLLKILGCKDFAYAYGLFEGQGELYDRATQPHPDPNENTSVYCWKTFEELHRKTPRQQEILQQKKLTQAARLR